MAKYLVIVESPGKTSKIQHFLGNNFNVIASVGHVKDLPKKALGVDIKNDFEPTYETLPDKIDVVKNIISQAKKSDIVYLATDEDREGEQISALIKSLLPENVETKRITYNSITKEAVLKAIDNPREIDTYLVNAAECRRVLDRLVGWKTSFITQQATGGKSAGRVQSPALRVVAEREKEIKEFVPIVYWDIEAELVTKDHKKIVASIKNPKPLDINTEALAKKICESFTKGPVVISKFEKKEANVNPYAPFTTSTMLQAASSVLHWSADRTTKTAQDIYTKGFTTYIRTDSTYVVPEAINSTREMINKDYGKEYLPTKQNFYSNKPNSQEAHEAIRPTDINIKNINGTADENDLYRLIWKRAVSSQMEKAKYMRFTAEFSVEKYILGANGSKCLFDGWRKVWDYGDNEDQILPELNVGEKIEVISIESKKKETQPPSRYSEASFIKKLEDLGIGRPSTYKTIITTLRDRGYIEDQKKALVATELGINVSEFLVKSNFCFADLKFTANMEKDLDEISENKKDKLTVLKEFWDRLKSDIANAQTVKSENSKSEYKCPICKDAFLVKKHSKFGSFYSCENYSKKEDGCTYTAKVGESGEPIEKVKVEIVESDFKCKNCKEKLLVKLSKKGNNYLSCRNWNKDKGCEGFFKMTGEKMEFKKKVWKKYKK